MLWPLSEHFATLRSGAVNVCVKNKRGDRRRKKNGRRSERQNAVSGRNLLKKTQIHHVFSPTREGSREKKEGKTKRQWPVERDLEVSALSRAPEMLTPAVCSWRRHIVGARGVRNPQVTPSKKKRGRFQRLHHFPSCILRRRRAESDRTGWNEWLDLGRMHNCVPPYTAQAQLRTA